MAGVWIQPSLLVKMTLASDISDSDTSLDVLSGEGANLPAGPWHITIWDEDQYPNPADDSDAERMLVQAAYTGADDTITPLSRGTEGTTAVAHSAGAAIISCPGKLFLTRFQEDDAGQKLLLNGGVHVVTATKTGAYTITRADRVIFCDTTGGSFEVTLPSSPAPQAGMLVTVKDVGGSASSNNITVGRNGKNIDGVASDLVISTNYGAARLIYDGTEWWTI